MTMLFQAAINLNPLKIYQQNPDLWSFALFFALLSIFWSFLILTGMHKVQKEAVLKKTRNMLIALGLIMGLISTIGLMRMGVSIEWLISTGLLQVVFGIIGGFLAGMLALALFGDKRKPLAVIIGIIFGLAFSGALFTGSRLGVSAAGMWGTMFGLGIIFLIGWGVVHAFKSWKEKREGGGTTERETERASTQVNKDLDGLRKQLDTANRDNAALQSQLEAALKKQSEIKKDPLPPLFSEVFDGIKDEGWLPPPGEPGATPPPLPQNIKKDTKALVDATKDKLKKEEDLLDAWMNLCGSLSPAKAQAAVTAAGQVSKDIDGFEKLRDSILKSVNGLPPETAESIRKKLDDATHKSDQAKGVIQSASASVQKDLSVLQQTAQGEQSTVQRMFSQLQPLFKELGDIADQIAAEAAKGNPDRKAMSDLVSRGRTVAQRIETICTEPQYGLSGDIIRQLLQLSADTFNRMRKAADQAKSLVVEATEEIQDVQRLIGTQLKLQEQQGKAEQVAVASTKEISADLRALRDAIAKGIADLRKQGGELEAGAKKLTFSVKGGWAQLAIPLVRTVNDSQTLVRALGLKLAEVQSIPNPPQWVINLQGRLESFMNSPVRTAIMDLINAFQKAAAGPASMKTGEFIGPFIAKVIDSNYDEYLTQLATQIEQIERRKPVPPLVGAAK